jgi:predicted acyltransferase
MTQRNPAIDVMRGLTLAVMIVVNMSVDDSYGQLQHSVWNGLTLTDVVFPTFLFVVGAALAHTLGRYERQGEGALLGKLLRRTLLIFLCGYLLYWFPFLQTAPDGHLALRPLATTRIPGVLQRIALCYGLGALVVHYAGRVGAWIVLVGALLGYWALLAAFGDYTLTGNAVLALDRALLGAAHLYHGEGIAFDPEGILSTLPALANVLAGFLAANWLDGGAPADKARWRLALAGVAAIAAAVAWDGVLPINKKIWTSSYALCTIGIDLVLLAAVGALCERTGAGGWQRLFEVLGRNTLFIYLLSEIGNAVLVLTRVDGQSLFMWLYLQAFKPWAGAANGALLYALVYMLACWLVAWMLDRRRIYIRL